MRILKKSAVSIFLFFIMSIICVFSDIPITASANELSDEIFSEWEVSTNNQFGEIYNSPEQNAAVDDILNCCMSVVDAKKGNLIDDAFSINLCFNYNSLKFSSDDDFAKYYKENIYYPLFALYPDTAFGATVKSYYGSSMFNYMIIIEICINGKEHSNAVPTYINGELFTGFANSEEEIIQLAGLINELAQEADAYSDNNELKLKYVYDFLVGSVTYGSENLRAYTSYGALIDKLAVCQGYSMVIQDVCYVLDIPCIMNYSISGNHGWNSVFLDGEWKFIDATNKHFLDYSEDEIPNINSMYDFDKEKIGAVQNVIMNFYNLSDEKPVFNYGDADNNGVINTEDALFILNYVISTDEISSQQMKYADMDGDGQITSYDALMVLESVVGLI